MMVCFCELKMGWCFYGEINVKKINWKNNNIIDVGMFAKWYYI